jgi:CRP/FNR family transcriptional regulator, cyclic AMP receptor protein
MPDPSNPQLPVIGLLKPLGDEDRMELSSYGQFIDVKAGETLIEEGSAQEYLYIVISGQLHAISESSGRPALLGKIHSGQTIGEMNIFDPSEASASVRALGLAQVWRIDRKQLEEFLNRRPLAASHILIGIAETLSRRLRERIASLVGGAFFGSGQE